ncbi:copper amine oxidase N-terminal domain-containing protein [Acetoanaerobium sticklandii]|uniref:copper amine oxidase N-terminal domain-containing protein n=1 Tax=Acetoanaerobium sticklandii TaxID=1511 RepID=UPI003A90AF82
MKANEVLQKLLIGAMLVATLLTPTTSMALSKSTIDTFNTYPATKEQIESSSTPMQVYVQHLDGTIIKMNLNYPVMVLNNRSAVAVKDVTDNLKADLTWDNSNKVATINKDGNEVAYPINKKVMSLNGKVNQIDTNATIYAKENRTYLPFASLADSLGMQAIWTPKGTNGATQNSIILAPKGATASQIPASIQPPPVVTPPIVTPPAVVDPMAGDKYLNSEQIEWVYKQWEANGISRAKVDTRINDFIKDYKTSDREYVRNKRLNRYYTDIAIPKGWDKKIKVHPDLIYTSAGADNIQGIEFKTENGIKYQRLVFIPVNYEQEEHIDAQGNTYSKLYVLQLANGEPYGHGDWIKMN